MNFRLTIILLVLPLVAIAYSPETDLSFYKVARNISNSCSTRQTPGRICETCQQLSSCVDLGNSNWATVPVQTCDETRGFFCTPSANQCTTDQSICNQLDISFKCNTGGVFPDPFDCQTYHFCYADGSGSLVKVTSVCAGESAFSAASGDCSATVADDLCLSPQFHCGEMGAWPGNSNIFYVCTIVDFFDTLIANPQLFRCDAGLSFTDGICA